jgi:nitroimidazol reductase NimA-like FMN-containing flavoprotein (pyridoxamine 5'-phosphate oxidase superfamily)
MNTLSKTSAERFLAHNSVGRLGCYSPQDDQMYVVPISYRVRGQTVYFGCLLGRKLDCLRAHPAGVCLEVDQVTNEHDWISVVVTGRFEELSGFEYLVEQPAAIARAGSGPLRAAYLDDTARGHGLVLCALRIEYITGRRDVSWTMPDQLLSEYVNPPTFEDEEASAWR